MFDKRPKTPTSVFTPSVFAIGLVHHQPARIDFHQVSITLKVKHHFFLSFHFFETQQQT
jgi:hypothetical protein